MPLCVFIQSGGPAQMYLCAQALNEETHSDEDQQGAALLPVSALWRWAGAGGKLLEILRAPRHVHWRLLTPFVGSQKLTAQSP